MVRFRSGALGLPEEILPIWFWSFPIQFLQQSQDLADKNTWGVFAIKRRITVFKVRIIGQMNSP
jgi:hypothetical protein